MSRQTATFNGKIFRDFNIHPKTASLYGRQPEDIIEVEITIADNQTKSSFEEQRSDPQPDYWGWLPTGKDTFSFVYHKYFLLEMCFPYGLKVAEESGQGRAYRVNIKQTDMNQETTA